MQHDIGRDRCDRQAALPLCLISPQTLCSRRGRNDEPRPIFRSRERDDFKISSQKQLTIFQLLSGYDGNILKFLTVVKGSGNTNVFFYATDDCSAAPCS